ncbi:MAG TPA: Stp1/IreP family PP2C-type Ser/Thr phosphatase [Candidatus Binatia bacterium]|nr:Stp1/IreP family PP2C-type Ser/Thr phosphatase [Candidatus Binatia bacterium]
MCIDAAVRTDVGRVRLRNEDSYGLFSDLTFYVVADGMGGHVGGEIASGMAVETMLFSLRETQNEDLTPFLDPEGLCSVGGRRLFLAVQEANRKLCEKSRQEPQLAGMGTTVAAVLFNAQENLASICHVGDSRVYRIREGEVEQLTEDHSLVQQLFRAGRIGRQNLKTSPHRHVLTRALGVELVVQPSLRLEKPRPGDIFLLCSDGVHGVVDESEILSTVTQEGVNLQDACDTLVDLANERGGQDNSTVILLRYRPSAVGGCQP